MDTSKLTNYDLTIEQLNQHIDDFVKQDIDKLSLNECKLSFRVVDMIQATIGNTNLLKEDFSYYSAMLNNYAALLRQRMFTILASGIDPLYEPTTNN